MASRTKRSETRAEAIEVPASEVKNAWHRFLDRVSQAHEEIVITRYGKPVARLAPVEPTATAPGIFGCLAGSVQVKGDLTAPTGEAWDADADA
jgi:prevent-host-death family protein